MLEWSLSFFVIAVLAGIFGFGGMTAPAAAEIGQALFLILLLLFLAAFALELLVPQDRRRELKGSGPRTPGIMPSGALGPSGQRSAA